MNQLSRTIPKRSQLKPSEDYYSLRREGIGYIEQLGSASWTDYNTHDPGITILEALSYAITDLAYRTNWDIQDILTPATPSVVPNQPFPNQAFFTARNMLTVNPWTPDDFRRMLIDLQGVRNAWVFCKACVCDVLYYAWCDIDRLIPSYEKPTNPELQFKEVKIRGFYEVQLELESDPELGDLNDRKLEQTYHVFDDDGKPHTVTLDLRFPDWGLGSSDDRTVLLQSGDAFAGRNGASFDLKLTQLGATKTYDLFTDPTLDEVARNAYLRRHWQHVVYASFEITLHPSGRRIVIPYAGLRIFGDTFAKSQGSVSVLKAILEDRTPAGVFQRYRRKLLKIDQAVVSAKEALHRYRNLNEDYCRVKGIEVEDVAVCADVEVRADADIERVQAQIWLEIERYFNPPIPFYSLNELLDAGTPVEDIFNGPSLDSGFVKAEELDAAGLKTELRTSDIVNCLMDIDGVVAVNNLLLSKYDTEGNVIKGAADPALTNGSLLFDADKVSAAWLLVIGSRRQPRLYRNLSRFLFYKNGLPFMPRMDEARDTLIQLRGEVERPKLQGTQNDLPVPAGKFRDPEQYTPVQYGFPLTYGIGPHGLPSHASPLRRAQAKQLKAYLMVFEQFLGNAFAQLAHTADLFSLDPTVKRTYFAREFSEPLLQGYTDITSGLNRAVIDGMTETESQFHERRNRFLDHLMARFGEQFVEYAMLLTNLEGKQRALDRLIADKIALLKVYPQISRNKARAFDYTHDPCSPDNISGLKKRVSLLLGYPDLAWGWAVANVGVNQYDVAFRLNDQNGMILMEGSVTLVSADPDTVTLKAYREIIRRMILPEAYTIVPENGRFRLKLQDINGNALGLHPRLFEAQTEAKALRDELVGWSANERAIVVEHLLLRPKFPGDALFPACTDGPCKTCGDEDPYSFRLTVVMPGWTAPFNVNLEMRDFADRTIKQETPSHLLVKTCWVGNDGFVENPCDPVVSDLAELLVTKGRTSEGKQPSETEDCQCALAIYRAFSLAFQRWYQDKVLQYMSADALAEALDNELRAKVTPAEVSCAAVLNEAIWADVQTIMVKYFHRIASDGWQFDRFEQAWCKWLEINAEWDWTEERLSERIEAILRSNINAGSGVKIPNKDELCKCAAAIVVTYGAAFYGWMEANIEAGIPFEEFAHFDPEPVTLCAGLSFKSGTDAHIGALLKDRYGAYKEVSYRLWVVVNLLAKLRSTYPGATLHDCDDGSDENPVRLGKTALGQYPLRRTLTPSESLRVASGSVGLSERPHAPNRQKPKAQPSKSAPKGKRKRRS